MLNGLRSHVCVDSFTNSYMSLICQLSTPSEVTWRGVLSPNIPNSATCDVKNSLLFHYEGETKHTVAAVCAPPHISHRILPKPQRALRI